METYTSELSSDATCLWIFSIKNKLSVANCSVISTQKDSMHVRNLKKEKDIVSLTQASIQGRHSIDAEMNAESFEYANLL